MMKKLFFWGIALCLLIILIDSMLSGNWERSCRRMIVLIITCTGSGGVSRAVLLGTAMYHPFIRMNG